LNRRSPRQPTTWLQVSGHRFLIRRIECALLHRDVGTVNQSLRTHTASLALGCLLASVALLGCGMAAWLRPQVALDRAQIVMGRESGALFVRVGDTWHPVLNLASARLIAATDANPQPVPDSALGRTKRGPLLGISGAPQLLGRPLTGDEAAWTICDRDGNAATTIVIGRTDESSVHRLAPDRASLVAAGSGSPAYLLYDGRRAVVDLADAAVVRALRLEDRVPHIVSQALLSVVPEAPAITAPRIRGAGGAASGLLGFTVGSVLRIIRGDGDEYYVVLTAGVQRIGHVAADLLRFSDSQRTANAIPVAPDVIRAAAVANTLPVSAFPDRAPALADGGDTYCATWAPGRSDGVAVLVGTGLPVPAGQPPVTLAQADGAGPALDGVYLPPGRSAYVRDNGRVGVRYLVTDTGVRFAIHGDEAAHDLGLPAVALPAPWPMLAALPAGPELSRANASVARDGVAGPPRTS
jgi:type VII secretion protein EccB